MKLQSVAAFLLLLIVECIHIQETICCTGQCDTSSACLGFGEILLRCENGTVISNGYCYFDQWCRSIIEKNEYIKVVLQGMGPQIAFSYLSSLQGGIKSAYDSWCLIGDNFKYCCPGSSSWTSKTPGVTAMRSHEEVTLIGARGSSSSTVALFYLQPVKNSSLCSDVDYPTTTSTSTTTTTTTTTTTMETTTSSNNSDTIAHTDTTTSATDPTGSTDTTVSSGRKRRETERSKRSTTSTTFYLSVSTIASIVTAVNISVAISTALASASNSTVAVVVSVQQNYASSSTQSPQVVFDAWIIAAGSLGGLLFIGAIVLVVLHVIHNSKMKRSAKVGCSSKTELLEE